MAERPDPPSWIDPSKSTFQAMFGDALAPAREGPSLRQKALAWTILIAGGLAVAGSVWLYEHWWSRAPLGAPCTRSDQCRSERCLALRSIDLGLGPMPQASGGGVCTHGCERD